MDFLRLIATLVLIVALPASAEAVGASAAGIQRCIGDDGTAIYTDKPCGAFAARPTGMSGDLVKRLAYDSANTAMPTLASMGAASAASMGAYRDASEPLRASLPGRRSASAGCARSPQQLTRDLLGSFALRDVNRVAESYHWVGLDHGRAVPVMRQLERMAAMPLADARFLAAWIGTGDMAADDIPSDAGLMQLVFGDGSQVVDLQVRRYSGCYFVRF